MLPRSTLQVLVALSICAVTRGQALRPELVADINRRPSSANNGSRPKGFLELGNGFCVFGATTAATGFELFRTNATGSDTKLVRDLVPGKGGSTITSLCRIPGQNAAVFSTVTPRAVWRTDGTARGTVLIQSFQDLIGDLVAASGDVFFAANNGLNGMELWATDGRSARLVKDIRSGAANSFPTGLTEYQGKCYFGANGPGSFELWVSDGTEAGTKIAADINPRGGSRVSDLCAVQFGRDASTRYLLFSATKDTRSPVLWSLSPTGALREFTSVIEDPRQLTESRVLGDGDLFFSATSSGLGGLYVLREPTANPVRLAISPVSDLAAVPDLKKPGHRVFCSMRDALNGDEPWVSDGTEAGTRLLKDLNTRGIAGSFPQGFTMLPAREQNLVVFSASAPDREPWVSDGTAAGTVRLRDIAPGFAPSNPAEFGLCRNVLLFQASDGRVGIELWRTDGTTNGTVLVADINRTTAGATASSDADLSSEQSSSKTFGQRQSAFRIPFAAEDGIGGREPHTTNGQTAATKQVADVRPGRLGSNPRSFVTLDDKVTTFIGSDATGEKLFSKGDGPLQSILPEGLIIREVVGPIDGLNFVTARDRNFVNKLVRTDGTRANTKEVPGVTDFRDGARLRDTLWGSGNTGAGQEVVAIVRGQVGKTLVIRGTPGSDPRGCTTFRDWVVMSADDGKSGREPWQTDGSKVTRIHDIAPGAASSNPRSFTPNPFGDLYFLGTEKDDEEIWRWDGKDAFKLAMPCVVPDMLTAFGDGILFCAEHPTAGNELHYADRNGVRLVADLNPGAAGSDIREILAIGLNTVIYVADDGNRGRELHLVEHRNDQFTVTPIGETVPGPGSSAPKGLRLADGNLLFSAYRDDVGTELFTVPGLGVVQTITQRCDTRATFLGATSPKIGASVQIRGESSEPAPGVLVIGRPLTNPVLLPPGVDCPLLVNPIGSIVVLTPATSAQWGVALTVPNATRLIAARFVAQAARLVGESLRFSTGLLMRVGR